MLDTCFLEGKKVMEYNEQPRDILTNGVKAEFPR